jgi:hypothetical protein
MILTFLKRHINAFQDALNTTDITQAASDHTSVPPTRVRKVSALSDFAPISLRVRKRKKRERYTDKHRDWLFLLLRWPLLVRVRRPTHDYMNPDYSQASYFCCHCG